MTTTNTDLGVEGKTIGELFANRAKATPNAPAFMSKQGGAWHTKSWGEAYERAERIAHGLLASGLKPGERVAILAGSREEWTLCDLALVMAAGVTVPLYPSNTAEQCAYILNDSESAAIFVENAKQLAKIEPLVRGLAALRLVCVMDGAGVTPSDSVVTLEALEAKGAEHKAKEPGALAAVMAQMSGDSTATIIYTSGTTGNPKGVVVAHDAFTVGTRYGVSALPVKPGDLQLLFLPLAHSFGKMLSIVAVRTGFCTAFAESIEKLVDNIGEVRPDWMAGVPRIYEKVYSGALSKAKDAGGLKWKIFQWALGIGKQASREIQAGRKPGGLLGLQYGIADKLVFSKLRQRFGGKLRWFISGSAPLSRELAEFFHAAGMLILEGYGLTETNSLTSINREGKYKFGTVGPVLHADLQVKIAADGEILTKGVTNLRGYYKLPDATKEAIDEEGWFHTGDIGEMDADGFIKITDRKKDLIKTSGGKYVAPQMIEGQLKMDPLVSQAVVIGDQRKYVTALVALNPDVAKKAIAEAGQSPPDDVAQAVQHEVVKKRLDALFAGLNKKLGSWEQVKYYKVLPRELTEADSELTPTLKIKRKVVTEHFRDLIEAMYAGGKDAGKD
jgi:long-chain acyl-CoA synthetase